jgi:hypothetical protein
MKQEKLSWSSKLETTPEAMKRVFGSMPRCRIAMEVVGPRANTVKLFWELHDRK